MNKQHVGYALIAVAVGLELAEYLSTSGTFTSSPSIASALASVGNVNNALGSTIHVSYLLGAVGVYLAFIAK